MLTIGSSALLLVLGGAVARLEGPGNALIGLSVSLTIGTSVWAVVLRLVGLI